ncbi:metallophosphoesterase [Actinomadura kijaniata]|uniref:metallophosphoesterase n=1 Tax=Actinomadura kijaniata TaxID=46161 RepID=UPI003F1B4A17
MAIIAQLSDIHLAAGPDGEVDDGSGPVRALRAAVSSLLSLPARPDAVVLTGDLADGGRPDEYARLHALLSPLPMAVYPVPGNHDDRDALRAAFKDHPAVHESGTAPDAPVRYAVDVAGTRLVCCDTSVRGGSHGTMDDEQIAWLDATLAAAPDVPTVIATHHPAFPVASQSRRPDPSSDPTSSAAPQGPATQIHQGYTGPTVTSRTAQIARLIPLTAAQVAHAPRPPNRSSAPAPERRSGSPPAVLCAAGTGSWYRSSSGRSAVTASRSPSLRAA